MKRVFFVKLKKKSLLEFLCYFEKFLLNFIPALIPVRTYSSNRSRLPVECRQTLTLYYLSSYTNLLLRLTDTSERERERIIPSTSWTLFSLLLEVTWYIQESSTGDIYLSQIYISSDTFTKVWRHNLAEGWLFICIFSVKWLLTLLSRYTNTKFGGERALQTQLCGLTSVASDSVDSGAFVGSTSSLKEFKNQSPVTSVVNSLMFHAKAVTNNSYL